MGLLLILIGGLIITISSIYLLNNLVSSRSGSGNPSSFQAPVDSAKDTKIISDFQAIQEALNLYKGQKGQYPDNLQKLNDENLIHSFFINPYTQTKYRYKVNGDSYTLSTNLGSGKPYQLSN